MMDSRHERSLERGRIVLLHEVLSSGKQNSASSIIIIGRRGCWVLTAFWSKLFVTQLINPFSPSPCMHLFPLWKRSNLNTSYSYTVRLNVQGLILSPSYAFSLMWKDTGDAHTTDVWYDQNFCLGVIFVNFSFSHLSSKERCQRERPEYW